MQKLKNYYRLHHELLLLKSDNAEKDQTIQKLLEKLDTFSAPIPTTVKDPSTPEEILRKIKEYFKNDNPFIKAAYMANR